MNLWQEYKRPASISEAIRDLTSASGSVRPIAGGTDLLLDLKQGRHAPIDTLIDLTFVPEMNVLELRGDELYIGAAVPANRIALDPLVGTHAQALVEACNLIAGPQVRNVATLGGNAAHALPAADGTITLTASKRKLKSLLFPGRAASLSLRFSSVRANLHSIKVKNSLLAFIFPKPKKDRVPALKRIMRPQGVALPILNCAVWIEREKDIVKDIHIAVGPGGAIPFRATEAEDTLRGKSFTGETFDHTLKSLLGQAHFRTSARRASSDYRKHIVGGLFRDTLEVA